MPMAPPDTGLFGRQSLDRQIGDEILLGRLLPRAKDLEFVFEGRHQARVVTLTLASVIPGMRSMNPESRSHHLWIPRCAIAHLRFASNGAPRNGGGTKRNTTLVERFLASNHNKAVS